MIFRKFKNAAKYIEGRHLHRCFDSYLHIQTNNLNISQIIYYNMYRNVWFIQEDLYFCVSFV